MQYKVKIAFALLLCYWKWIELEGIIKWKNRTQQKKGVRKLFDWNKAWQRQNREKNEQIKTDWISENFKFSTRSCDFDLRLSNVSALEWILCPHNSSLFGSICFYQFSLNIFKRLWWYTNKCCYCLLFVSSIWLSQKIREKKQQIWRKT